MLLRNDYFEYIYEVRSAAGFIQVEHLNH
jgi:hypothetical protein